MQGPKMILADEPIASLDPRNAQIVMDSLRDINAEGKITVITNLHTLDTARAYCERIIGMSAGKVVFEGELGIVIGKTCSGVAEADALDHVFGYTCANDVTVSDILNRDASFAQWTRAKGFDTFCPMGPVVATGLDPSTLTVTTTLNGEVRQNYPISDMRFSVQQLVSLISFDMTLNPGDVILCGTSVGVGSMKPGSTIEVEIGGIGRLSNCFG
jgi:2-keto-4-pentenoate hydratase/2-oxohepta-3-ene-1,7-dioic acid hydratase in catechol pathway